MRIELHIISLSLPDILIIAEKVVNQIGLVRIDP
jgi:hypothetical protein